MKISCIIPTRNRCRLVLQAIASVRRQQADGMEIIVVDDGSTDHTMTAVAALFPEVHVVKLDGLGPGPARNAGVAASCGEILMFLDSDDIWLANHVQQLAAVLNRGYQIAYGTTLTRDEVNGGDFLIPENGVAVEGDCFPALLRWCFLVPSGLAVKRDVFQETGGFAPVACGEDWLLLLKLAARHPFGFAGPEPITLRRLHRGSLCFLRDRKKPLAIISQVLTVLEKEPRATAAHCRHFKMLYRWTAENMAQWSTVQEWYQAMRREKII